MEYRFLWVEFQLKAICAQVSDYGIEETLQNIPDDIDATYERILDKIDKNPRAQRELGRKALLFVAYARRPVSIATLALAIAAKDHTQSLDMFRSSISTEKIILDACGNLLSVDNTATVRFVHFSVHEFLTSHRSRFRHTLSLEYEVANREIARMCMVFLLILYSHIQDHCTPREQRFAYYTLHELPHHLLAGNLNSLLPTDELVKLAVSFFEKCPPMLAPTINFIWTFLTFSPSVLALIFNLPGTHQGYNSQVLYGKHLSTVLLNLIYGSEDWGFKQVSDNRLAMHYAVSMLDSVPVSQRLYTQGYPIDYSYKNDDEELHLVESTGPWMRYYDRIPNIWRFTPLYLVKSEHVARFLIDSGASVNPPVHHSVPNLLGHISKDGDAKLIQLLLDSGAGAEQGDKNSALQTLALGGMVEAMRLLLDNGADVNAQGGEYGNALQAAACCGNAEAIRLLLDKVADVNAQGGKYFNALQAAAYCGNVEAIRLLLDKGADVNAQGGKYGNTLQAAAYSGNAEAIRLLLDKGADVNAQGGEYGNALHAATSRHHSKARQLLLDRGADANTQDG